MILAWRGDELSHGQTQNGVNFDFEVKFHLEGQGQSPPKTIGTLTKVFYTYGPNLVILAQTGDELSRGQACGYCTHRRTHRQTDGGNDNTRRPKPASGNKMAAILKAISNLFSCIKIVVFSFKFHWHLFPRSQSTISQHSVPIWHWKGVSWQASSHYLNQWWPSVQTHAGITQGLDELTPDIFL